jgi:hypothetical protein
MNELFLFLRQILTVARLELKKTFFSRRSIWVYLLAFAPVAIFFMHSINEPRQHRRLASIAEKHPISSRALNSIEVGDTYDDIIASLGKPYNERFRQEHRGPGPRHEFGYLKYTDGDTDIIFNFYDRKVVSIIRNQLDNLPRSQTIFATSFQVYFIRLAVFFGCVGIFINLFRGEILDKSLHFYLLTPMRREVLLCGKYLAGLLATIVIFTSSTALQWFAMLRQFDQSALVDFYTGSGWSQFQAYLSVTVLACIGYGSVFLTVGMLFRYPVIPTISIMLWESINSFLPANLKKISMIYYLQSLCPVKASQDSNLHVLIRLLIAPAKPATPIVAIVCIVILTLIMLVIAGFLARRLQINYSID